MTGSHYNQLIDNEIFGDNNALVISESHHNLLKGNNIDSGFDNAIVLAGFDNRVIGNYSRGYEGGIILGGSRNLVADNRIGGGMRAVDLRGNFNRIEANTIEGGGEEEVFPAMRVRGDSNRITANQIIGWVDGFPAMDLGGNRNQVGQNVIVGDHPLVVTGDFNRIRGNRITGWDAGFPVVELGGNRNQVTGNAVVGRFPSLESCSALVGVRVTEGVGNQLARNWVTENCTDGILVDGAASETRLLRNLVAANGEDGIDVEDPTAKVSGNTALENGDYGIEGVPGVRGGGNQASGNGNPAQCLEIACN